ncbi:uncharacterized protein LOC111392611 [Olea europaea var. sylvestris]|uniref:uncharacterized protein LOC111392611 n=1 Tax=Olea europaea var. sylvestris TaxID=158386 RepID=UPI000C1D1E08|nr:uncharacterized protein LOC111392611 [Olea europaea var. sylvestris]
MASDALASQTSSPYLLHPSNSPSLILVTGHLTGDNFPRWQRALRRALSAKNKLCFVDGSLKAPNTTSPDYAQWSRTKDKVLTWILNTIIPSLANSLDYRDDPHDVWLDLESRFCHGNNACLFQLKREISNLHQNQLSIPDYYNSIKQICDELDNLQSPTDASTLEKRAEDERLFQFLLGLNDSFAALRTQILATDPLPPLNKVFSILFQEEKQRLLHVPQSLSKNLALAANHEPRSNQPSLLGKPPVATASLVSSTSSPMPGLSQENYQQLMMLLHPPSPAANFVGNSSTMPCSFNPQTDWIIDSSASDHMSHCRSSFSNLNLSPIARTDPPLKRLIGAGEACNGLYLFRSHETVAFFVRHLDNKTLWYQCLGHPSSFIIPTIFDNPCTLSHCDVCEHSKHTRLPFQIHADKSSKPFYRLYCDIWGGYPTASICGAHYFLTIIDDLSSTTWIYLMHFKSETFSHLMHFFALIKNQFNSSIKIIRIDNGQEFLSHNLQTYFHTHGIIHERACVETPQQNGVAERKHRHLLNVARSICF